MKVQKKISVMGQWAKPGEDIKEGGKVTILDGGTITTGNKYGDQTVFQVETINGPKNIAFNQTTTNNLIDAFGDDTDNWIGKEVNSTVLKVMIAGELKTVVYLYADGFAMDNKGKFYKKDQTENSDNEKTIQLDESEVDIDKDIPF